MTPPRLPDGRGGTARLLFTLPALLALFWSSFAAVRPTNFGGFDEWLVVDLSARGIVDFPYANRPLTLIWVLPAALLLPRTLYGYFLLHTLYLCGAGVVWLALCGRLAPREPLLPVTGAALLLVWAPLDPHRLNALNNLFYSGVAFGTLLAILLFLESWTRHSPPLLALACAFAFVAARSYEAVLGLLVLAPIAILWFLEGRLARAHWRWLAAWETCCGSALVLAAKPVLWPSALGSYQASGLGLDAHPGRWLMRLARQLGFHLLPALSTSPTELQVPGVPFALAAWGVLLFLWWPRGPAAELRDRTRRLLTLAGLGLFLAGLAASIVALSGAITIPDRVQGLTGPGIALFLAALVCLPSAVLPRAGALVTVALSSWLVAAGVARTAALQRGWDGRSAYPAQSRLLCQLVEVLPAVKPHTLIVLVDDAGAFPAVFTFRHVVRYLYGGRALGYVWEANDFLYPTTFGPGGIRTEPWPGIRGPWQMPPTLHGRDEVIVVHANAAGRLAILDRWPDRLPGEPQGAYDPQSRIEPVAATGALRLPCGPP